MDWVPAVLEGNIVAVDIRWEKDFGVPGETLAGGEVGDQSGSAFRIADVNDGAFLFGE